MSKSSETLRDGKGRPFPRAVECVQQGPDSHTLHDQTLDDILARIPLGITLVGVHRLSTTEPIRGKNLDDEGVLIQNNGKVLWSLQALAYILSRRIYLAYDRNEGVPTLNIDKLVNKKVEEFESILRPACARFNAAAFPEGYKYAIERSGLTFFAPHIWGQRRYLATHKVLLGRSVALYSEIPGIIREKPPSIVNQWIIDEYGVKMEDLGPSLLMLWSCGVSGGPILTMDRTFLELKNFCSSPPYFLLRKIARPVRPWAETFVSETRITANGREAYRRSMMPLLHDRPALAVTTDKGEGWSLPIPKLLLTHAEECVYWRIFDRANGHFHRPDNEYTSWYGHVVQRYVLNCLKSSMGDRVQPEFQFQTKDGNFDTSDCVEFSGKKAVFVEVKNYRPRIEWKASPTDEAVKKMVAHGRACVEQVLRWLGRAMDPSSSDSRFQELRDIIIAVVTPEPLFLNEIGEVCEDLILEFSRTWKLASLRVVFLDFDDIEAIPRIPEKKKHVSLYSILSKYRSGRYWPHLPLKEWLISNLGEPGKMECPYVDEMYRKSREFNDNYFRLIRGE